MQSQHFAHACTHAAAQDPRGQASACCKLGLLYRQQGKLEAAVGFFERFFELARSLGAHGRVAHC